MTDISWLNSDEEIQNTFTMKKPYLQQWEGWKDMWFVKTVRNRFVRGEPESFKSSFIDLFYIWNLMLVIIDA